MAIDYQSFHPISQHMSQESNSPSISEQIALSVFQQAIAVLLRWAAAGIPDSCKEIVEHSAINQAQKLLGWHTAQINVLHLLFNHITLTHDSSKTHYIPLRAIEDCKPPSTPMIPYPCTTPPTDAEIEEFKQSIRQNLLPQVQSYWNNFSWLVSVLEKYGSCVSYSESTVALVDLARITAAIAVAIANGSNQVCLVAGDLSGIQKFIYTIASSGALKSLRARSFYLEIVTEEVVQQLLKVFELPRSSVIYAGGGNLYLLAPAGIEKQIANKAEEINQWLYRDFQGKIFLSLAYQACAVEDTANKAFIQTWSQVIETVNAQKTQKFVQQLDSLLNRRDSHAPCKVCHRDDQKKLYPINPKEPDSVAACVSCQRMFRLGGQLFKIAAIVRSTSPNLSGALDRLKLRIQPHQAIYYHLFEQPPASVAAEDTVFLINNWRLSDHAALKATSLLLGSYSARGNEGFMTAQEFADCAHAQGSIKRVGYLRMDVDRLGQIFAKGLGNNYALPKLAGLSRQMSYFFKVYLNSLANNRIQNFLAHRADLGFKALTEMPRQELLFIYAGGDDLFVSGAWNQVVEFSFDVYQAFRAYTGHNPDITLSGGISIEVPKFPLYQAAQSSGDMEDKAKGNDRDSLGLFGEVFKWNEWLGTVSLEELDEPTKAYLSITDKLPPWVGIWEFINILQNHLTGTYKNSFVRNLLLTAQIQEQQLEEKKQTIERHRKMQQAPESNAKMQALNQEERDIRYYLHLPKVAYTLARLPSEMRRKDEFKSLRASLLSPCNAPYFRAIATWIELLNRN